MKYIGIINREYVIFVPDEADWEQIVQACEMMSQSLTQISLIKKMVEEDDRKNNF